MTEGVVLYKGVVVAAWFVLLFAAERIRPAAPPPESRDRLFVNGAFWLLALLISPLVVLPLTAFAADHALWRREGPFASFPMLAADIVLLDLWVYALHRAYHETPLWRLHVPHHYDRRLDTTTAVRFHPAELALSAMLRMAPIVVLAVPFVHVVAFETLLLAATLFHHSNIRLSSSFERALSRVIVTPSIHWVHHHARRADTNANYGAIFSVWDRLFATKSGTARTADMAIGVEGAGEKDFAALLLAPLRKP